MRTRMTSFVTGGLHPSRHAVAAPDVPCTTLPTGSSWYSTVNSNAPLSGTSAAMPYEWVRLNWKLTLAWGRTLLRLC